MGRVQLKRPEAQVRERPIFGKRPAETDAEERASAERLLDVAPLRCPVRVRTGVPRVRVNLGAYGPRGLGNWS